MTEVPTTELGFLLSRQENVRPEEYETSKSIVSAVLHGIRLTKQGITNNNSPLFTGRLDLTETDSEGSDMALIEEKTATLHEYLRGDKVIFHSTRDGWNNLCHNDSGREKPEIIGLPEVVGFMRSDGTRYLCLSPNSLAQSTFNMSLLGRMSAITIQEDGSIGWHNGERLSKVDLAKFKLIFEDAETKLGELEFADRGNL